MRTNDLYIAETEHDNPGFSAQISTDSIEIPSLNNKDDNFLISVIVPVYHEEKILESTLSVYTKELKSKFNYELIVSDGGSTDKTVEIARKYADKITIHTEERKQTISEGRNKGAEIASGEVLVFINGDTVPAEPEKFFAYIEKWAKKEIHTDSKAIACKVDVSDIEKQLRDIIFYSLHNFYVRMLNLSGIGMGRGECQIVRKVDFKSIGGYNPNIAAGEDFDLYHRLAKLGKIHFTRKISVLESPRRFRRYGYIKIIYSWIVNSLSVMISGKSVSKEWEAVR